MKYKVTGRIYCERPHYYEWDLCERFPIYDRISQEEWIIEADSLEGAKNWFYQNHPEGVQGGSVCRIKDEEHPDPEFVCFAVPSAEYGVGNFETVENRVRWARNAATK